MKVLPLIRDAVVDTVFADPPFNLGKKYGKNFDDEIHNVDIVDCNAGSHGKAFATNFNPEINIREITARGRSNNSRTRFCAGSSK